MMIYKNVHVLDFSSLYPNLIRQMRLSPENEYSVNFSQDPNMNLVIDKTEFNEENGLLDSYITELLDLRKEYRQRGMESEQLAVKIIANSVYGLLSQKTAKFILGGTNIAATVTWAGRTILQTLVKELPKYDIEVVYGKTDSIFVIDLKNRENSGYEVLHIAQHLVDQIVKNLTGFENRFITFDYEEFLTKFLVVNKNNYVKLHKDNSRKMKGASFYNSKSSQFEVDLMNHILDNLLDGTIFYKRDVQLLANKYMESRLKKPLSYFAIKHKPRQLAVNKWDNCQYMREHDIDVQWGFYHNAVVANGINNPTGVLVFPLDYEPESKYTINRNWVQFTVDKVVNKLNLKDRELQTSLTKFFR